MYRANIFRWLHAFFLLGRAENARDPSVAVGLTHRSVGSAWIVWWALLIIRSVGSAWNVWWALSIVRSIGSAWNVDSFDC